MSFTAPKPIAGDVWGRELTGGALTKTRPGFITVGDKRVKSVIDRVRGGGSMEETSRYIYNERGGHVHNGATAQQRKKADLVAGIR